MAWSTTVPLCIERERSCRDPQDCMAGRVKMLKLKDIMTRDLVTVEPETSLKEVADLLASRGISGVPVITDSGDVVGVISASDIVSFAAAVPVVPTYRSVVFSCLC
jgi:CBS domain-containing protein